MVCCRCKKEPKESICQSCAMPMQKKEDFGTEKDGSASLDYCRYCFQKGSFTDPTLTKEKMLSECSDAMKKMGVGQKEMDEVKKLLPQLKRWKK